MASSRLPFFSPPVVAFKAPPATGAFGFTWQEVATRMEGFSIEATDKIGEIYNCPHEETRESLAKYVQSSTSRMVVLYPGEYVCKIEVCYTEEVVTALKIHTTKRVTPWFGETKGWRVTFQADEGFCINALRGTYGPQGCSQFGVVFAPKEIAREGHCVPLPSLTCKTVSLTKSGQDAQDGDSSGDEDGSDDDGRGGGDDSDDGDDKEHDEADAAFEFRTVDLAPRAIVVKTNEQAVASVRVVTAVEYDRIVRFPESFQYAPDEQWLALALEERILAVGVEAADERVVALSFKTNLHASHIFGPSSSDDMQWVTSDEHAEAFVCGFAFDVEDDAVIRLDVLYNKCEHADGSDQASTAA